MAATGKTPILLYGSTTATNAPVAGNLTNSSDGCEIAINVADKNLFFKDSTNVVNTVPIRQSSASSNGWLSSTDWSTFNGKAPSFTYTTNYVPYGQGTTTPTQSSAFTFDGSNLTSPSNTVSSGYAGGSYNIGYTSANAGSRAWRIQDDYSAFGALSILTSATQGGAVNVERWRFETNGNVNLYSGSVLIGTSGNGIDFSATAPGIIWRTGVGSPEGVVTAAVGSLYTRSDGGANTTLYVKQSGTGNTGWAAK